MIRLTTISLTGLLLFTALCDARFVEKLTQKQLLVRSDVVIIARLENCHDTEKSEEHFGDTYVARRATFVLESVLKGEKVPERVTLSFYRRIEPTRLQTVKAMPKLGVLVIEHDSYRLAEIPDFPSKWMIENLGKSENSNINTKAIEAFRKSRSTEYEYNPVYILYLKRTENDEFLPVGGMDSWQSVNEIHYTKKRR